MKPPLTLDYESPGERQPSFWSGLWSEFRSEVSEIPFWLLAAVGGLLLSMILGLLYVVHEVSSS
jgi:hypothetical protein